MSIKPDIAAVGLLVVLHKHIVPDLPEAPRVGRRRLIWRAIGIRVVEDLAVWPTRPSRASRPPPVVGLGQERDPALVDTERAPDRGGLIVTGRIRVAGEAGDKEPI